MLVGHLDEGIYKCPMLQYLLHGLNYCVGLIIVITIQHLCIAISLCNALQNKGRWYNYNTIQE